MSKFQEFTERYETSTMLNHQGFVLKSFVQIEQIKLPLVLLMTDAQKERLEKYQGKTISTKELKHSGFILFTLHSVAAATVRHRWFTGVKVFPGSSLEVYTRDSYSADSVTLGTFKEFNLTQFVSHIKEHENCITYYAQWAKYFPELKIDIEKSIETNPYNIGFLEQTKENCLKAVKLDGLAIKVIAESSIDEDICIEAISHTAIAYMYCPLRFRTEELWQKLPRETTRYIIKDIFLYGSK